MRVHPEDWNVKVRGDRIILTVTDYFEANAENGGGLKLMWYDLFLDFPRDKETGESAARYTAMVCLLLDEKKDIFIDSQLISKHENSGRSIKNIIIIPRFRIHEVQFVEDIDLVTGKPWGD